MELRAGLRMLFMTFAVSPVAVVPAALGPGNPFAPGLPQTTPATSSTTAPRPVAPAPQTSTAGGGSGLSGTAAVAIAIGAVVILGGISLFIWRDARRRAPVRRREDGIEGRSRAGSKARPKPRKPSPAERRRRKRGRAR